MKNYILIALTLFCLFLLIDSNKYNKTINHYQLEIDTLNDSINKKDSLILHLKLNRTVLRDSIYIDRVIIKKIKEEPVIVSNDSLIIELKKMYNE